MRAVLPAQYTLPGGAKLSDQIYETAAPADAGSGTWPGDPDSTTVFPQTMKVDWVRVYARDASDP